MWHDAAVLTLDEQLWSFGISPVELLVRSLIAYAVFLAALRVSGSRRRYRSKGWQGA